MKKALIVANLAGFACFLINDIKTLQDMGYHVTLAANRNLFPWEDTKCKLDALSVEVIQVDFDSKNPFARDNGRALQQMRAILKTNHYDFIHCHTPISGLITRLAAIPYRVKGTKIVYTTHGFAFTRHSSGKSQLMYRTLEDIGSFLCDAMITINREDYEAARRMHCKNVYYIHGVGVDVERYRNVQIDREAYRKSIGVAPDQIMVLSVGALSERKNQQIVIRALATLPDKDKYVFVVCGEGEKRDELLKLAKEKQVNCRLLGFRHDIPEITKCSDVGVLPSIREGLGLAGVQSLAAGVPIVGTDVQGIRDCVVPGKTGYLCDAFDAENFARYIQVLGRQSCGEREEMARNCMKMAQNFGESISVLQMKDIYNKILAN